MVRTTRPKEIGTKREKCRGQNEQPIRQRSNGNSPRIPKQCPTVSSPTSSSFRFIPSSSPTCKSSSSSSSSSSFLAELFPATKLSKRKCRSRWRSLWIFLVTFCLSLTVFLRLSNQLFSRPKPYFDPVSGVLHHGSLESSSSTLLRKRTRTRYRRGHNETHASYVLPSSEISTSRHDKADEIDQLRQKQLRHQQILIQRYGEKYNYQPPSSRTSPANRNSTVNIKPIPDECGTAPKFFDFFQQSDKVRSFRNEDRNIYQLFFQEYYDTIDHRLIDSENNNHSFTYVELGAFNGIRESNTRFFDVCLGWDGLLIEANPMKYAKLLQTRPHAHCLNYAPSCDHFQTIGFHSVSFTNAAQADVPNFYDNSSIVQVPCDRLTPVVVDVLEGHVTFFSLDVEGAEAMVLRTVDFTKLSVDVWMVENVNSFCRDDCPTRDEARSILQQAGYVGYTTVVLGSDVFVRPNTRYHAILNEKYVHNQLPMVQTK